MGFGDAKGIGPRARGQTLDGVRGVVSDGKPCAALRGSSWQACTLCATFGSGRRRGGAVKVAPGVWT